MDKEVITRAAEEAIRDLQLDCEITDVTRPLGKDSWCIQFTGSYGQFSDAFHDKEGKENSARVIREKIKRFFLKQRKPARIVRGRNPSATARRSQESNLLGTLLDAGEGMLKQASRIAGEVVERAANLNRTVLETEAEWVETVSPTMAEVIRPDSGRRRKSVTEVSPPQRIIEPVSAQPPKQVAQAIKSERRTAAGTGGRTKKKPTTKARTTKKTGSRASKTASAVTAKKSVTKKKGTKTGKKTDKKRSSSKKSRTAIRNFY